jgi:hypothetical protein
MRFFSEGPCIPDLLLERRDRGRVVFLCGAGVSLSAGMPTFYNLAKYVVDFFDPPKDSAIDSEFRPWVEDHESGEERPKTPLDQIFHLLYQEYGREEVNALVADRLQDARKTGTESNEHRVIARISSDREGKPQIVTTNFDLLFEKVLGEAEHKFYQPPAFPDISLGVPLTGITYLHGRLQDPDTEQHPYVLSSADFGRAYLSEGWATNFIRSLLKSYTVVLIGYQAEDPPVKYLLQGLNHDGLSDRSNLYAFDKGEPEDIEVKWRDRGVTAIACKDYPSLWQSLEAWAERANNPRQWRSHVINMATKGPRQISAHERGQVAHLVRTTPGARLFARTNPSPPPEWLCVFDAWCRVAKKSSGYGEDAETFDPFGEYGLDDDPPRPTESNKRSDWVHDHILEWRRGDTNPSTFHRLGGRQVAGFESMPPRLSHLCNWITNHIDSPTTAWWAVRQRGLHPRLKKNIENELRRKSDLHPEARRAWNLILEYQSDSRNFSWDGGWYEIKDRISNEGWSPSVLRDFETITSPILSLEQTLGIRASKPPLGDWEKTSASEVACWKAKFPDMHGEELDLPDDILESVFRILEGHFRRAAGLLVDLNTFYFSTPTCYPEREINGEDHNHHEFFRWFLKLFIRLVSEEPETAKSYASIWPTNDKFYFRKLKLFALNHVELFGADEAVEDLLAFSQESFWDYDVHRELLFLINDRWEDFSVTNRKVLADRLLNGPDKMQHWSVEEYPFIRDETACRYTRWLTLQGKELPEKQASQLEQLLSRLPEWNDSWASSFVEDHLGSVRGIGTDEAPDTIIDLPVSKVVERAQAEYRRDFGSYTNKRPFTGLVKVNPRKALASLSHLAKSGQYPKEFWSTLISDWPKETTPRLFGVFLHRFGHLPHETIRELRYPVGQWLNTKLLSAFKFDEAIAWRTFDHLVAGLISEEGAATGSGIGELRSGGEVIEQSRRTFEHAINSPVGKAMEGLHNVLSSLKLSQGVAIPVEFKLRIEHLLAAPGDGRDHAVTIITRQISWLYYLDPSWIKERVMLWFSFDHDLSEPAWNGYLSAASFPPHEIGAVLKPLLLELFPRLYQWSWDQHLATVTAQIAIELAVFRSDEPDGLNLKEARHCLRNMNEKNRQDAIFRLGVIGKREENGWSKHVIPFINKAWPREHTFRTSNLVSSWVSLLERTGEKFPEVLSTMRRFLVPVERESHWLYNFGREIGGKEPLTIKYPADVLELLDAVIPNSPEDVPYNLAQILDLIEDTDQNLVSDRRFLRLIDLIEQT